ncbi:hypothetical protein J1N35_038298 [Gossypium stocksii]|uniref:Uncharacterized protein n=1 Tax=Gossypium stocksii TaxID=47602 RepID=A0A9D3UMH1_9ROSI|nr:hypothetical protein J1N35_038298 [Gossypium stocksii]
MNKILKKPSYERALLMTKVYDVVQDKKLVVDEDEKSCTKESSNYYDDEIEDEDETVVSKEKIQEEAIEIDGEVGAVTIDIQDVQNETSPAKSMDDAMNVVFRLACINSYTSKARAFLSKEENKTQLEIEMKGVTEKIDSMQKELEPTKAHKVDMKKRLDTISHFNCSSLSLLRSYIVG